MLREKSNRVQETLEHFEITDEMAFPPTTIYLPSVKLIIFMINRAAQAKKDVEGNYGFIF